jgi:hypothetical protein
MSNASIKDNLVNSLHGSLNVSKDDLAKKVQAAIDEVESVTSSVPTTLYKKGNKVFIRTVTHHYVGRIVRVTKSRIILEDAAWVACDGRFANVLKSGVFEEVEPYTGLCELERAPILDATLYPFALPLAQK